MNSTSILYHPLFKSNIEINDNLIKIKTYQKFLSFYCAKCKNENILIFKGAGNYYCNKCGEKITVKLISKTFRGKTVSKIFGGKFERKKV